MNAFGAIDARMLRTHRSCMADSKRAHAVAQLSLLYSALAWSTYVHPIYIDFDAYVMRPS